MFCPMISELALTKCLTNACGMWNEEKNCCSIKSIAKELSRIQVEMNTKQVAV